MMTWCLVLSVCLLFLPVSSQVVINEVYYDHPGSDDGYEFVELINVSDAPVALDGCALEFHDGASGGWTRIWSAAAGDTIVAGALYVIGEEAVIPVPDVVTDLGLQNGPDALRLVCDGLPLDVVGYGELDDPALYEGAPAPDVSGGESLARALDGVDTDDNANDFAAAAPTPGFYNVPRRDVAIERVATPLRRTFDDPLAERFRIRIANRGIDPLPSGIARLDMFDSTATGVVRVVSRSNEHALAPGGDETVGVMHLLTHGLHRVSFCSSLEGDERAANNSVVLLRRVGHAPVIISEVMSRPSEGCPEYVELFNNSGHPYDLSGHWIRDATHEPVGIVASSVTIATGGYVVLTADAAGLRARYAGLVPSQIIEVPGPWPSLNHTGSGGTADSIVVLDRLLLEVDAVAYPPQPADTEGRSLERVDLYAGRTAHTWTLSTHPSGGTPGGANTTAVTRRPSHGGVIARPNPFAPSRGERLLITAAGGATGTRATVYVYDVEGRRLATIGSVESLPFVFVWEGRDGDGRAVPTGLYIVACEFVGANDRWVEKVVVGCAR